MGTLITILNEVSARDLFFDLLLLLLLFFALTSLKTISFGISRRPVNMQALSLVHSVTLLSSTIVDNNLDAVFDQTWAPTHNLSRQIYLTTDCTTRTDLSPHC